MYENPTSKDIIVPGNDADVPLEHINVLEDDFHVFEDDDEDDDEAEAEAEVQDEEGDEVAHDPEVAPPTANGWPFLPAGTSRPLEVDDMYVGADEVDADNLQFDELTVGAMYPNMKQFKKAVKEYAIRQRFMFKKSRSTPKKYAVVCKEPGCKWRISGISRMTYVLVKKFVSDHTCTSHLKGNDNHLATSPWVAETCLPLFDRAEDVGTRIIRQYMKSHWGITMTYRRAHLAMNIILEIKCGNVEDSYRLLPALIVEMMRTNPGTYMRVFRARDLRPGGDDKFARLFWAFGPSIRSFQRTLRSIVLVDGTHLRGKYLGILLIAVGVDGNNGLVPLAFGVVETENEDSWCWFLYLVKRHVLPEGIGALTLCSDRQKGLMQAVPKARNENAHNWIAAIPKENWASFYFKGERYDVLTTNRSECYNAVLKDAKKLPIAAAVELTRFKSSEYIQKRQAMGLQWETKCTHYAEKHLGLAREQGRGYTAYRVGVHEFEVRSRDHHDVVNLLQQTCTCREFQTLGLPCEHAMAAIAITDFDEYDYCHKWFRIEMYRETYCEVLHPTVDRTQWELPPEPLQTVLPPIAKRPPGRPRTRRSDRELQSGVHRKCTICGKLGHNKRTCREPPMERQLPDESFIGPSAPVFNRYMIRNILRSISSIEHPRSILIRCGGGVVGRVYLVQLLFSRNYSAENALEAPVG
ncbi:uncharacterized protein LOC143850199 [Tasmannia lanceolata]|uniref:uncharacterized protein LOC143850199 n=1 Tax=Tasmannia lanceolata TaxID=3420 RepID=UPI00406479AB